MFRWLTDQYPSINRRLSEGLSPSAPVDNFYLDMNGIIHPCTHGNSDEFVELREAEMFRKIFLYTDRLYKLVRPSKLLYLAVDGVAPRAKMNQQRSRRFRSSKEAEELMSAIVAREGRLPAGEKFDSNCITPGTDFMLKLALAMDRWVEFKIKTDPFWKEGARVVVSGPNVPGEGEHKVMDYIRWAREGGDPDWGKDGPLRHVLYGLDADLIMLGLVTHEPNFNLLREKMSVVMAGKRKGRGGRGQQRKPKDMLDYQREDFELLELSTLREMFDLQFRKFGKKGSEALHNKKGLEGVQKLPFEVDTARVIDDFVFMCMLVGNDFIPHSPHLAIDTGALSLMLGVYTDMLPVFGGYLTDKEKIHPERFQKFVDVLASYEQSFFQNRGREEKEDNWSRPDYDDYYYGEKLKLDPPNDPAARRAIVRDYMEALHWCLNYYHNGCKSWGWFFPHLYAPLMTDMTDLKSFYKDTKTGADAPDGFAAFDFDQGKPFPSLVQLLSVLPPQSSKLLPDSYAALMGEESPLVEFYPRVFETDANGKRQSWESVVKIPFIESDKLMETVSAVDHDLTPAERRRNMGGEPSFYDPKVVAAQEVAKVE
ncbi:hypothetical protein TeGR_g6441 [Tetraparma gracilis]|uniref:Uncharacterized protein n=1 Tax=Tetraparma gracilis TaxID=2962635 RepID=A0ABQ6N9L0_9STRA|nr:hypothetical protein TeGR_g6441 [Tetraparma gracilis]